MWSKINALSKQSINYLIIDRQSLDSQPLPKNVIQVINVTFMPKEAESIDKLSPFSFCVVVFEDAKKVLNKDEIISEISQYKAPFAEYIDTEVLYKH